MKTLKKMDVFSNQNNYHMFAWLLKSENLVYNGALMMTRYIKKAKAIRCELCGAISLYNTIFRMLNSPYRHISDAMKRRIFHHTCNFYHAVDLYPPQFLCKKWIWTFLFHSNFEFTEDHWTCYFWVYRWKQRLSFLYNQTIKWPVH